MNMKQLKKKVWSKKTGTTSDMSSNNDATKRRYTRRVGRRHKRVTVNDVRPEIGNKEPYRLVGKPIRISGP